MLNLLATIGSPPDTLLLGLSTVSALAAKAGVMFGRRALHGTTLVGPLAWYGLSLVAVVSSEWVIWGRLLTSSDSTWRYLATITTLCPAMAVLGAKRPQDRGWQFVVVSLYFVLALPALQALAFAPGGRLELHPAWRWFLITLVAVGLVNHLPTRFAIPALVGAAGQLVLLQDQWPLSKISASTVPAIWGTLAWTSACGLAVGVAVGSRRRDGWNRVWLDFRDLFGIVWAIRVADRVNHVARIDQWQMRLTWRGFVGGESTPMSDEFTTKMELSLRTLLRRFVSRRWIDARLGLTDIDSDDQKNTQKS